MEEEIKARLDAQEKKIDAIYVSVEKTRKYFLWTLVATSAVFVLPLIAAAVIVPMTIGSFTSSYGL